MKKLIIISVLLIVGLNGFGQKWHLNEVNEESKYKYEYWFQFEDNVDSNWIDLTIYQINSKKKLSENTIIEIMDCVREDKSNPYKCTERKKYLISMHI